MLLKPLLIRTKIRPYESLSSLSYRLTQANAYDRSSRIYEIIGSPQKIANNNLLSDRAVIKKLSILNNCSEDEIFSTTSHHFAKFFLGNNNHIIDPNTQESYVLSSRTKYCPLCVEESGYHKIYWDLSPVTVCLNHKIILQNSCPKCNRPVTVDQVLKNKCICGENFLSVDQVSIAPYPEAIRNQFYIQSLLEIDDFRDLKAFSYNNKSPAMNLSPADLFKLLKIFTNVLTKFPLSCDFLKLGNLYAEPPNWITKKNRVSNITTFILTNSAISVLLDWPQKFYNFLDEYKMIDNRKKSLTGVTKDFIALKERVLDKLDIKKYGFIHHAYSSYLNEQWTGGHVSSNIKYLDIYEGSRLQKKHITIEKTTKILQIDRDSVKKLIDEKIIKAEILEIEPNPRCLVNAESVYILKRKVDKLLTISDLTKRLSVNDKMVYSFIENGLLSPFKLGPWNPDNSYYLELEIVENFEKEFLSEKLFPVVNKESDGYLSITDAIKHTRFAGINGVKLLQLVREGVLNPALCKEGKGLSRLLFNENELKKYRDIVTFKKKDNNKLSVNQAAVIMRLGRPSVHHLINSGLITAYVDNVGERQKIYVQKKDLDEFSSRYAFIKEAAELMGFKSKIIFQWIRQGRLKDHSGAPLTKTIRNRILLREDIKRFMQENFMDVPQDHKEGVSGS